MTIFNKKKEKFSETDDINQETFGDYEGDLTDYFEKLVVQVANLIKSEGDDSQSFCESLLEAFYHLPHEEASRMYGDLCLLLGQNKRWQRVSPMFHEIIMVKKVQQAVQQNWLYNSLSKIVAQSIKETPKDEPEEEPKPYRKEKEFFHQRVKDIICKAASKNGQRIETFAKGHERSYIFHVDAELFCRAMDELLNEHEELLKEYLGGTLYSTQVSKVCFFIGRVVEMHLINDNSLQLKDLLFAFEDYYPNILSVKTKLSAKDCSPSQKVLLGIFQGLLRRYRKRE